MIPPLVALISASSTSEVFRQLVRQLDDNETPTCEDAALASLEHVPPPPPLRLVPESEGPRELETFLNRVSDGVLVPNTSHRGECLAVRAGLLQIHDCLDASHTYAQRADDTGQSLNGSYWHAIMHRREPDYGNAGYWLRRVGRHPTFERIGFEVRQLLEHEEFTRRLNCSAVVDSRGDWDPMAFNELCRECGREWNEQAQAASKLQSIEMRVLLEFTCDQAVG